MAILPRSCSGAAWRTSQHEAVVQAAGGAPAARRARRRAACAPACCRRGTPPPARAAASASRRIASVSRNALSAWLATTASSSPRRGAHRAVLEHEREPRGPPPPRAGRPRVSSASAHDRRPAVEPERVEPRAHGLGAVSRARAPRRAARPPPGRRPARRRAPRSTDGLPAAVSSAPRASAASRFPPITSTRVPARTSSSILRHDGGHDSGPPPGQGRRGVPDRGTDRPRRHGRRLPGGAPQPAPARRDQDHRPRAGRDVGLPRALQPRGADRRRAAAPEHRHGLRRGRGRRPALPRDAVHRGLRPRRRAAHARAGCARTARSTSAARSPPRSTPRTAWG